MARRGAGTLPGGLVLGTPAVTFAWPDIAAYEVGIAAGTAADRYTITDTDRTT